MKSSIDDLQPVHLAAGIGAAERDLLAVCLGVFDDAKLLAYLKGLMERAWDKIRRGPGNR